MPIFYSHAGFSDHFEPVNSKRKIKADDSAYLKVIQDVVSNIKYDYKHLKKKKHYYYVNTQEQLDEVLERLKETNIEIEYEVFDEYIQINIK